MGRLAIGRNVAGLPPTCDGQFLCVADARLYRAPGIAGSLDLSTSERERLFCRLHGQFGNDAPNQLEGDFAYAIWDDKTQQLTLARDHAGVRPLFYFHKPHDFFAWASHPDMIVRSGLASEDLDVEAAIKSFVFDMSDPEGTLIPGLRRLPAAHVLRISSKGLTDQHRYWKLRAVNPIKDLSHFEDCATQLRDLLDAAVSRRLPKQGQIGAHLSGGLDSTAISVLAARILGQHRRNLHTYSFVSELRADLQFIDERPYVDATLQSEPNLYNTKITPADCDDVIVDAWADRLEGFKHQEEKVLRAAHQDAVDVILSGWGGDEIVTYNGRGSYAEYLVRGRWRLLWAELKGRSAVLGTSKARIFANEVLPYFLPANLRDLLRLAAGKEPAITLDQKLKSFLRPAFRNRWRGDIRLSANTKRNRLALFHRAFTAYRLESWALQGAPHGIQYAFPLLDRELIEFAIRLPTPFFMRDGMGRAIFREAMQDVLPESVRTRRKKLAPFPCSLMRLSEQKSEYLKELSGLRHDPRLSEIFDFDAVERALDEIPDPDALKASFVAEATGGDGPSMAFALAREPIEFARFLTGRLKTETGATARSDPKGGQT
ncbi:hypothetical protein MGEO_03080 [Marivita geojedonensis]|uniref:asparagine synthase (glutamine-hydrolyzing) n=2 Tax=Marivita geojedonensis TaxID=1123756 RepID=A0A1X4NRH5_9RHOB|nr:hypothetical protein MGEO_03080 [Marivita geojedonensis]